MDGLTRRVVVLQGTAKKAKDKGSWCGDGREKVGRLANRLTEAFRCAFRSGWLVGWAVGKRLAGFYANLSYVYAKRRGRGKCAWEVKWG